MSPSELLPFQRQAPLHWPFDPQASDPTQPAFWIAYAAAKCAAEPSVEAVWVRIWYMAYVLRRLDERLAGCRSASALGRWIRFFRRNFHPWLPRRCFQPRPGDAEAVGFTIAIGQIAQTVDLLAEHLIEGWDIRSVYLVGARHEDDVARDTRGLLQYIRYPEATRPAHGRAGTYADRLAEHRAPIPVPHFGLPMPWAAGLLALIERTTGACDTPCPMNFTAFGMVHLLRGQDARPSFFLRVEIDEGAKLCRARDLRGFDDQRTSHPLFSMLGDELPKILDGYRAWRALAGKPIFQDTCKWHPDDEEIV